jgi:predicted porin
METTFMHSKCITAALLGTAALACTGVAAQAQVQVYGTVDVAVGALESQPPGPPHAPITKVTGVHNGGVQTSYLGFRGSEDLGGGLRANVVLESFMRMDTGVPGRFGPAPVQDPFFSRASWVGLQGGWGEMRLGNVPNPAWLSLVFSSAMGSNSLFSPAFRQQFNGSTRGNNALDTSLPNVVAYSTPSFAGLAGTVAWQAREASPGGHNIVANVVYRKGPLMLTAAVSRVRHAPPPDPASALDERLVLAGGSYDFGALRGFVQYGQLDNDLAGTTDKMPQLGVVVPLGVGEWQLAWARDRTSGRADRTRTTTSTGYIHHLSKRSSLYLLAASDKLPVGTANSAVVGMRHAF